MTRPYASAPVALETFLAEYTAALTGAAAAATMPTLSIVPPSAPAASRGFTPPAVNGAVALAAAPLAGCAGAAHSCAAH